jgi:hypothetical protein
VANKIRERLRSGEAIGFEEAFDLLIEFAEMPLVSAKGKAIYPYIYINSISLLV